MKRNPCVRNGPDEFGAGEGIRTLDPDLGNPTMQRSLRYPFLRENAITPSAALTFCPTRLHLRIRNSAATCRRLLPPRFPGHCARAGEAEFRIANMAKLTKRLVDAIEPDSNRDVFAWDGELRGFGIRVKPSGTRTYFIQYRNSEGRSRRLVLGQHGVLAPQQARDIALQKLAAVARGEDPSADRHAARAGMTVAEVCDWYLQHAKAGKILGRKRRPIKQSSIESDQSRIEAHIKPLIGMRSVRSLTLADIEGMQADIVAGRTAKSRKGRGGHTTGGTGAAARTISTLRSLLGHAKRWNLISSNPAMGVRQIAGQKRVRRLSIDEIRTLGVAMRACAIEGEHPTGLAAIRVMLLTGFRRLEALGLQQAFVSEREHCVRFPDTKSGAQVRVIGQAAVDVINAQRIPEGCPYVFPADWGDGHFIGVVRVLSRVCKRAELTGVTPHVLRHTFASIAAELGFSELTIAGLLGHASQGVTQRYVHLDAALVLAADRVSRHIADLLDGRASGEELVDATTAVAAE
jgi:integrase